MAGVSSIAIVVVLALGVPAVALFVLYRAANRSRGLSTRTARGTVDDETTAFEEHSDHHAGLVGTYTEDEGTDAGAFGDDGGFGDDDGVFDDGGLGDDGGGLLGGDGGGFDGGGGGE